jgi:hypothetical protein
MEVRLGRVKNVGSYEPTLRTGTTIGAKENLMVPFPGEIHATVTNTWTLFKINIREIMNFIENY